MKESESSLRYVNPDEGGFSRKGKSPAFRYLGIAGKRLRNHQDLKRIKALVIPPAWRNVWICKDKHGHLQATGTDARRRKQYIYHPVWREMQEASKFDRCLQFAKVLPKVRRRVAIHLREPGLSREKVLATIVKLLDTTLIRVGNEEYSKQNGSFGLTTLLDKHATIQSSRVTLQFRGKSGVSHDIDISNRKLVRIIKRCQDLPGQQLFQYRDDHGEVRDITSIDVNRYLQEIAGEEYTAKDFRTWAATRSIAKALQEKERPHSLIEIEQNIAAATKEVARKLGNTIAVCRKSYIHPAVIEQYRADPTLHGVFTNSARRTRGMTATESAVIRLLTRQAKARGKNIATH